MPPQGDGGQRTTPMAYARDERALPGDPVAGDAGGGGALPAGPVHAGGARGDGPALGGREAGGSGPAVRADRGEDGRVDDDRDTGGALAATRRGRLPTGARSPQERDDDRLRIAVPVKGRLRDPSVSLLEDAGLGPE